MRLWPFFFAASQAFAAPVVTESGGKVFARDPNATEPLYLYHRREEIDGPAFKVSAGFKEPNGKPAIVEELLVENGGVKSYLVEQKQVGEKSRVEVKDGQVFFFHEKNGKARQTRESLSENFIVGATIAPFLQQHWSRLLAGETVKSRLAVLDRLETIGFKFRLEKEFSRDGTAYVRIKMSPTNFVIAAIVEPIYLTLRKSDARIVESEGMTLLRAPGGTKTGNLSARIVFD